MFQHILLFLDHRGCYNVQLSLLVHSGSFTLPGCPFHAGHLINCQRLYRQYYTTHPLNKTSSTIDFILFKICILHGSICNSVCHLVTSLPLTTFSSTFKKLLHCIVLSVLFYSVGLYDFAYSYVLIRNII